jgi:hypothetical protein
LAAWDLSDGPRAQESSGKRLTEQVVDLYSVEIFGSWKSKKAINPSRFRMMLGFLGFFVVSINGTRRPIAHVAQLVEHILGKDEVISSSLIMGSIFGRTAANINLENRNG